MGDTPTTVNQPAQTADQIIHAAIFGFAMVAAENDLIAQLPFLGFPVVKTIFFGAMNWFGNYIYLALAKVATFNLIDLQTGAERQAYAKAEGALRKAELSGDKNALTQATIDFKKALASVVHYDGSASP